MSRSEPLRIALEPSELSTDQEKRHEQLIDVFGQFIFWLRNWSLDASKTLINSKETLDELGSIRRRYYEGVARMSSAERDAAMLLAQDTIDGFLERFTWSLGDEGTDARFGVRHAYRFRIEMEIVDVESGEVVDEETINRGGRFFGKYWGRWLNKFGSDKLNQS